MGTITSMTLSSTLSSVMDALRPFSAARLLLRPPRALSRSLTTTPGSWRAPRMASLCPSMRRASRVSCPSTPQYIAKNMWGYVDAFLKKNGMEKDDVDFWAVHPGGRRIIEEAQNGLELTEEQTKYSWAVLSEYGNM